jgi:hypothetical protein
MVITSFKSNSDLYNITHVPFWFNEPPTLEHFRYLFHETSVHDLAVELTDHRPLRHRHHLVTALPPPTASRA